MQGLRYRSSIRAAEIPITPRCQSSPTSVKIRRCSNAGFCRSISVISAEMASSSRRRSVFHFSICCDSKSACSSSCVSSNCTAVSTLPIRPVTLMRGAIRKDTVSDWQVVRSALAFRASASSPGRCVWASISSPIRVNDLFSPVKGTTSASVAIATRSPYWASIISCTSSPWACCSSAEISLKAIAAPHK